jgi:hypothetical protein
MDAITTLLAVVLFLGILGLGFVIGRKWKK